MTHMSTLPAQSIRKRKNKFKTLMLLTLVSFSIIPMHDHSLLAEIWFEDFSDPSSLTLLGDATAPVTHENVLRLTPAENRRRGAAWYTEQKQLVADAWETTFEFRLSGGTPGAFGSSDGLAFVIQNSGSDELRRGGGSLGYNGMPNSLAVEIDTFNNGPRFDPSYSHLAIQSNGVEPNNIDATATLASFDTIGELGSDLDDGEIRTLRVNYIPGTMTVFLDQLTDPVMTASVDLASFLQLDEGRAWVGFTGAAGGGPQNHDVLSWAFTPLSIVVGDFNGNGQLDVADVDELSLAIHSDEHESEFDINGDQLVDTEDLGFWIQELKNTFFGDANLDGEFASSDLVLVFGAGQYEDGVPINSTWATGDWNGDREFTSSDLVRAFQAGGYEEGPRASVSSVPEPSSLLVFFVGAGISAARTRSRRA